MKRRTVLTGARAALTGGAAGGQETKKRSASGVKKEKARALMTTAPPDLRLEAHQIALALLLLDGSNQSDFVSNPSLPSGSIFDLNRIDQYVYQAVRQVYVDNSGNITSYWSDLQNVLSGLQTHMGYMGAQIQLSSPYTSGNPCPYHDTSKVAESVRKLTTL
jgi:hypothetical protein